MQSPCTLEDLASPLPVSCSGRKLERSLLVHFMTMGEYVDVMLQVRTAKRQAARGTSKGVMRT